MPRRVGKGLLLIVLATYLAFLGGAKIVTPYDPSYVTPRTVYYVAAFAELAMAAALVLRRVVVAVCVGTIILVVCGIGLEFLYDGRRCGCTGAVAAWDRGTHIAISCFGGMIASLLLFHEESSR